MYSPSLPNRVRHAATVLAIGVGLLALPRQSFAQG